MKIALTFFLLVMATGCKHVPAWDKGNLAHPTMKADDIATGMDGHVRAVSEGAAGGVTGGGGGCGCN